MELVPQELRELFPQLDSQIGVADPLIICKFFTPDDQWTWYAMEFDGVDTFYGWVCYHEQEFGSFSLSELALARGPLGMAVERDLLFTPRPISEVRRLHAPGQSALPNS